MSENTVANSPQWYLKQCEEKSRQIATTTPDYQRESKLSTWQEKEIMMNTYIELP